MENSVVTVAIGGCGARGFRVYGLMQERYADRMNVVALADPNEEHLSTAAERLNVPRDACYFSVEELLDAPRCADVLFLCTQDRQHVPQAIRAMQKGYDVLLEKPISPDRDECLELLRVQNETGRKVVVCHVLRYTPLYATLKDLLDSGAIGDIVTVQHIEPVGYWHQAHSFVRGNWRRSDETSPMILAKCCHDADLLLWLTGKHCQSVSSYGDTYLFRADKAPQGAALRCADCKVADCPYNAFDFYLRHPVYGAENGYRNWPTNVVAFDPTPDKVRRALEEGPYGRCVYHCDNDVVDHQVVNLQLEDGVTAQWTMTAFTAETQRKTRIMGTHGEITASQYEIAVRPFGKEPQIIDIRTLASDFSGHGGGDARLVDEFLEIVRGNSEGTSRTTSAASSVESHLVCLAAERSRTEQGRAVTIREMQE